MNDIVMSTNTSALAQSSDLIFNCTKYKQQNDNENTTQESESTLSQSQESPKAEIKS